MPLRIGRPVYTSGMGQKGQDTKTRLVDAARNLAESGGYFSAGLNQVIANSGAPRGSLYFHFPGGKDELISEAVTRSGEEVATLIASINAGSAKEFVNRLLTLLGDRLVASEWQKGCPVATVALDVAATNDVIQAACSTAYASWQEVIRDRFLADGYEDPDGLAATVLALIEGSLVLARAHRSRQPITRVKHTLAQLL